MLNETSTCGVGVYIYTDLVVDDASRHEDEDNLYDAEPYWPPGGSVRKRVHGLKEDEVQRENNQRNNGRYGHQNIHRKHVVCNTEELYQLHV